jgi:negative regulator of flagellin synthesis FlgM
MIMQSVFEIAPWRLCGKKWYLLKFRLGLAANPCEETEDLPMPNEINGFRPQPLDIGDSKGPARPASPSNSKSSGKPVATPATTDTVSLTETAARLRELEAALANAPDVDSARVEALRQAIAEGQYDVDSVHVAEKLVALERDLFGKPAR